MREVYLIIERNAFYLCQYILFLSHWRYSIRHLRRCNFTRGGYLFPIIQFNRDIIEFLGNIFNTYFNGRLELTGGRTKFTFDETIGTVSTCHTCITIFVYFTLYVTINARYLSRHSRCYGYLFIYIHCSLGDGDTISTFGNLEVTG